MKGYIKLRKKALDLLRNELSDELTYHGVHHTLDVLHTVNFYIRRIKVAPLDAKLLRIAALYHDIGFTETYKEHEKKGVEILRNAMEEFGCDMSLLPPMASMIMATKIPQNPSNMLEKIICDADLFYLGGKNYYPISNTLFEELKNFGVIETMEEWKKIQVSFLTNHRYHTEYARQNLQKGKELRIAEISSSME